MANIDPLVNQLAALIHKRTGNLVPAPRFDFLAELAARRAHAVGVRTAADYVRALAAGDLAGEWGHLVSLITIKESYFYRAPQQFEVLTRQLLPRLIRARAATRRLVAWSAACARGEEAATLAMVLAEHPALAGWDWSILATDIDEEALAGARRGLYGERAVALVPPPLAARYLIRRGKLFELAPQLLARIDYRPLNLARPPFDLPAAEYDLILLRNVLIYFDRALQSRVMAHVAPRLAPKGLLFLGASETLWQIQDELEALDLGTCYAYRHRRPRPVPGEPAPPVLATPRPAAARRPAAPGVPDAAGEPANPHPHASLTMARKAAPPAGRAPTGPVAPAPPPVPTAPELLIAAARELVANRLDPARRAADQALSADPSEPACHVLDGFLHDLAGQTEEAVAAYRAALYLDPSLFQPRLLLADCLLRLGRRDRAEHQYREILAALDAGRERQLALFDNLPLPNRDRALHRCRQVLKTT
jgi:chemotaxis protein methyltransferase CheR